MDFLPVFLRLQGQRALVVGGGAVALRKAGMLLRAGARICLVAPQISAELRILLDDGKGHELWQREFAPEDLDEVKLVVAATDDQAVNEAVYQYASARNLPVNVVDNPALCSFIFPSIVDRSPLLVAVSSGGNAPVLARLLRARLETLIPSAYASLAQLLGKYRQTVKTHFSSLSLRMRFWESIVNGPVAELVMSGQQEKAEQLLLETLEQQGDAPAKGEVYLVGAGPGDPDLLTFRALRLMQQADVVLYDRLVSAPILRLCRQDADRIHVGKQRALHTMPQQEISRMLVELAAQGKRVLRLKGGDPFIFGRGGEEIEELAAARIPFQIVPGITAASGCAAYAGIPLTHRDHAQSVRFVTGHLKDGSSDLDWSQLVAPGQTVVYYMGLVSLPKICAQLMAHGRSPGTPIALVEQGTTLQQKVHIGTLASMPDLIEAASVKPPTLIIVGEVVALHEKLRWREQES
ncbi:MAG TPA: uroporphyrinogen-III C-methyltransferase [Pseudomonadaceae bacterium]|nr:uroporphyrinogen-III C-methyltransferase [Pseudomonadaceae bacterium]